MKQKDFSSLYKSQSLEDIEIRIGYAFQNKALLVEAITHSTFAYENKQYGLGNNERMEFLGDGILDFVVADYLFCHQTEVNEGHLSKSRALVVCEATLSERARHLGIGRYLLLGKGEELTGGREKASNLANCMEAIFAAVYLDNGFTSAQKVILSIMLPSLQEAVKGKLLFDHKSKLLEVAQSKGGLLKVRFGIVAEEGPVHNRRYTAAVYLNEEQICTGTGASKKLAEQDAARSALADFSERFA